MSAPTPPTHRASSYDIGGAIYADVGDFDPARLFAADPTAQHAHWARHRRRPMTPERCLLAALLVDQLELLSKYAENARRNLPEQRETRWRREYINARAWVAHRGCGKARFSFEDVCDHLGLSAEAIRADALAKAPHIDPWSYRMERRPRREGAQARGGYVAASGWAAEQPGDWTIAEMAAAYDVAEATVRGWISTWKTEGHVVRMSRDTYHGVARYRWIGRERREVG